MQSPPSVRLSNYLLLNHWKKSNQIWCASCSHEWGVQRHIYFGPAPWGPGEGPKGQISLNIIRFQLQSQFQICFNQTLFVFLTHERYKTYQTGFSFGRLGHAPGVGLGGYHEGFGGSNFFYTKLNQI